MSKSPTQMAEAKFAATRGKAGQAMTVREKADREVAARTAKLRALRLAKEAAEETAAASPPSKAKKAKVEKPAKRATRVY